MTNITSLRRELGLNSLLSSLDSNPKVAKNSKIGVSTAVLHLAPARLSGYETCPGRSDGCTQACLHYAGSPAYYDNKTKARINKTKALFEKRQAFFNLLALELHAHHLKCEKTNMEAAMRLNATSDIRFESLRFDLYPWVQEKIGREGNNIIDLFIDTIRPYDYTKIFNRRVPDGYHLTYSLSEKNVDQVSRVLATDANVAVVFGDRLPAEYLGRPVIDGDEHDYRPSDPTKVIVGLKTKGVKGRQDDSGFVVLL